MDIIDIYKDQLKIKKAEIERVLEQMSPLQQTLNELKKEFDALRVLISPYKKDKPLPIVKGRFYGMTGVEAYKDLAKNHFKNKPFREAKMRSVAQKEGLSIRGKGINRNTSCGIIKSLYKEGYLERVNKGLYRYKGSEEIRRISSFDLSQPNQ